MPRYAKYSPNDFVFSAYTLSMKSSRFLSRRIDRGNTLFPFLLLAILGCGEETSPGSSHSTHHHQAPHSGVLVELGHHFANLEVVREVDPPGLTLYVLDAHAQRAIPLKQSSIEITVLLPSGEKRSFRLIAVSNPLTGEKPGQSSQFSVQTEILKSPGIYEMEVRFLEVRGQAFENLNFKIKS
ncbi:MAG: hypothetical protein QF752_04070 [Planctomycetota bacterium]|nr:hypothetical protein [Planctomycetota bacterium]